MSVLQTVKTTAVADVEEVSGATVASEATTTTTTWSFVFTLTQDQLRIELVFLCDAAMAKGLSQPRVWLVFNFQFVWCKQKWKTWL